MSKQGEFCVECHVSFGIADRSEMAPSTCGECYSRLNPSRFGECNRCERVIEVGDRFHLEWVKLCKACSVEYEKERGIACRCETVG